MIWDKTKECMGREEMLALQGERLARTVRLVYHNVPFYRRKMQNMGIGPDDIRGVEDLCKLPFTTKEDIRSNYPFGLLAVPQSEIARIHVSRGIMGKAMPIGYTKQDLAVWSECMARALTMAGVGADDILQIAHDTFAEELGIHGGAEKVGAAVLPISIRNANKLAGILVDFGITAIACTPSYLLYLAETLESGGETDMVKLKTAVCGAELWTERMRKQIEDKLHIRVHDIYGLPEIMEPGMACDCECHAGLHVYEDHFLPEIINPKTLRPLADGETGELVFTTITKEGFPLLRYRTRDLTSLTREACACGRTLPRIGRFRGRSDDMLIIRGINVFPSQIEAALSEVTGTVPHYRMIVERTENLDTLEVQVEAGEKFFSDEIKEMEKLSCKIGDAIQQTIGLAVKVKLVEPKSIERSMGKAVRVVDRRKLF